MPFNDNNINDYTGMIVNVCIACGSNEIGIYKHKDGYYYLECRQCQNNSAISANKDTAMKYWNDENPNKQSRGPGEYYLTDNPKRKLCEGIDIIL